MTTVACTLVSLCVCLTLATGLPAAKRQPPPLPLTLTHDNDDVLAGSDFLSVFMPRMRESDRPFEPHSPQYALNSVGHLANPFQRISDKYSRYKTAKYSYNTLEIAPTIDTETKTTTLFTEPTTVEDAPTTSNYVYERNPDSPNEVVQTDPPIEEETTKLETTTEQIATEKVEEKVISVRVSSSVARHSFRTIETSTAKSVSRVWTKHDDENLVSTLVTQEQPTITAVQRSEFGVEEAPLPNSRRTITNKQKDETNYEKQEEIEGKVQEVSVYGNDEQQLPKGKLPVFEIHFHNPPAALISNYGSKPDTERNEDAHQFRRKEFRQLSHPISYQSRISSPTSDSSVNFYRENPRNNYQAAQDSIKNYQPSSDPFSNYKPTSDTKNYQQAAENPRNYQTSAEEVRNYQALAETRRNYQTTAESSRSFQSAPETRKNYQATAEAKRNYQSTAETVNQPVISQPYPPAAYRSDGNSDDSESRYQETPTRNEEPKEQTYGEPEKVYGQPEVNYEVDEAVSVITNGKAHGVQVPTPPPMQSPSNQDDPSGQNKFGYVVEGRNFRKYRVEERTADGFIVGEYGVVSHDDGSLRGVRYTADSTINPRLIYDTLVKFLSLK
ncbi:uncharacterized protein LOC128990140 [Macrosteles quadrilineatus]|uniref:uncharacterized protein LOC128990140 n=1 Tax=Macrosteles quadrilineatus TaxID=74068 RepID=UPI0023E2C1B3|nr:uncharacterized protein LOC128990140 [Macrosteles quadrilineatus]